MEHLRQIISDQTNLGLILSHHVSTTEAKDKNLVCSPLSIQILLYLIAAGSSGPTRDQLLSILKFNSCNDLNKFMSEVVSNIFADGSNVGGPTLRFASGLWVDQTLPLKPTFKHVVDHVYKCSSNQVDFVSNAVKVASEVNSWAENQTKGLIKELLTPESVDDTTRLILANALYFKGSWDEKFDSSRTEEGDFHLLSGGSVRVPFMTSTEDQFIRSHSEFQVLSLPYKQGTDNRKFSMYIFLPNEKNGLPALAEKISTEPDFLNQHIPHWRTEARIRLPKFKISFGFEASNILKGLGIKQPFLPGGLTEMTDSPDGRKLCVSSISQKAFVEVNEEGTEAAAASVARVVLMCYRPPVEFVADHPFMFVIREETTGVVLFIGHVKDPSEF